MDMSKEAEKVKHLKKRVEDKKKARRSNEQATQEESILRRKQATQGTAARS